LKKLAKGATNIWLATDEDREGEAIGWHLLEALNVNTKKQEVKRIVFHEITEGAIKNALKNPRDLDQNLIDAQQARRILDRLVGYELSPLLWKKIRYGLSAGRVQSVAVRLVVDREREIQAFKIEEYWTLKAIFTKKSGESFEATLTKLDGKDVDLKTGEASEQLKKALESLDYHIARVTEKEVNRSPAAPFTTSTLQQEASRKLGFSVKKTMMVAQQLYEGVEVDGESTGLITYMRTDSMNLAVTAVAQAEAVIADVFGKEYVLEGGRKFKSRKGAQEAHEAIRPVDVSRTPEQLTKALNKDQFRLYDLIWKRMVASQMKEAVLSQVGVDVAPVKQEKTIFRATGQSVVFAGFMKVYMEGTDDEEENEGGENEGNATGEGGSSGNAAGLGEKFLPKLSEGEKVDPEKMACNQHFTKPPARYTEASLVKKMEAEGIGRPSTYAPTISTILARGYIEKEAKTLRPTDLGFVVTDLLIEHFSSIVDYQFTAEMEEGLDLVAEGKKEWVPMMRDFYGPFHKLVAEKNDSIKKSDVTSTATDEKCPKCGLPVIIKLGRFGKFYSCTNYPECKYTKPLEQREKTEEEKAYEKQFEGKKCEKCGKEMIIKASRYGSFLGCSGYPECKNIVSMEKGTGVKCPKCGKGEMIQRRARKTGKVFYGCNNYPKCENAVWNKPTGALCECGHLIVEKPTKEGDPKKICSECGKEAAE
jgi:DNA topoisomerase-1